MNSLSVSTMASSSFSVVVYPVCAGLIFSTVEGYWFIILADDRSQLEVAGISVDDKWFVEVWKNQECFSCHDSFHFFEGVVYNFSPLPSDT